MLFALDVLSVRLDRGHRSLDGCDFWLRATSAEDYRLDHSAEPVEYLSEHDEMGIPIRQSLDPLRFGQRGKEFCELFVVCSGLVVERMTGQVIDEIEQLSPLAPAPEFTEVDPAKREVRFDRLAVAVD